MKTETLTPKQEYAGSNQEYCDSINEYLHPNSDGHDPVAENNVKSHQPTKPSPREFLVLTNVVNHAKSLGHPSYLSLRHPESELHNFCFFIVILYPIEIVLA